MHTVAPRRPASLRGPFLITTTVTTKLWGELLRLRRRSATEVLLEGGGTSPRGGTPHRAFCVTIASYRIPEVGPIWQGSRHPAGPDCTYACEGCEAVGA